MLTIRLDDPVPIMDQILAGLRRMIAASKVVPGDELPPVRQLAGDLGVNLNTVARAYRALESDGLVSTVRGRGTVVQADRETRAESRASKQRRIAASIDDTFAAAKLAGLERDDVQQIFDRIINVYWPQTPAAGR